MKKLLLSLIFFFLLLPLDAAAKDFNFTYVVGGRTVTLKIDTSTTGAIATLTDPVTSGTVIRSIQAYKTKEGTKFSGPTTVSPDKPIAFSPSLRTHILTFSGLTPNTSYYFLDNTYAESSRSGNLIFTTEQVQLDTVTPVTVDAAPLTININDGEAIASGKIDIKKYTDFKNFSITLYLSQFPFKDTTSAEGGDGATPYASKIDRSATRTGIADDGTYYFSFSVNPSAHYYYKQVIKTPTGVSVLTGDFPSSDGLKSSGTSSKELTFDDRSYRLLAPWPGLSVLLDPDLCQEQKETGEGEICDFNDFLQYGFKILIGIVAVLLVFRIMIEGYNYIVSDIPALRANSKGKLMEAIVGLLLALSSYVILNTINPKLVESSITLDTVNVAILEDEVDAEPTLNLGQVLIPKGVVAACVSGIKSVKTKGGTFQVCSSIADNLQKMIDKAWDAGYKISGGGFRTHARQVELRRLHCGIGNEYKKGIVCKPPTAFPGKSRHESGLAFDLTCEGDTIRSRDNKCFVWLQANAKSYGLINFAKEPWHWSIDGK